MIQSTQTNKKRITILSLGSRGDVQPFLAMAMSLSEKYNVRMLLPLGYKPFAEKYGLTIVEVWPINVEDLARNNKDLRESMMEGDAFKFSQVFAKITQESASVVVEKVLQDFSENPPDLFLVGSLADYFGYYAHYVMKVKIVFIKLSTFAYNYKHAHFGLPTLPFGLHYFILKKFCAEFMKVFSLYDEIVNLLGKPRLDSKISTKQFLKLMEKEITGRSNIKSVYCQSSLFRDILFPIANPVISCYIGPCILDKTQQLNFNKDDENDVFGGLKNFQKIEEFFQKDLQKVPIYVGWGSMLGNSPENMILLAVTALVELGERAIILGGYADLSMEVLQQATSDPTILSYAQKNILFVKKASHEYLFPRVKCIVHHGGSGTTQAALRSGVPSIITPVFLDQFDHSYVINQLRIGVGFTRGLKKISSKDLALAIHSLTNNNDDLIKRCKEVATFVRNENGIEALTKMVDHEMQNDTADLFENKMNQDLFAPEIFVISIGVAILSFIAYLIVVMIK